MRKIKEIISIQIAKYPGRMVVLAILTFNIIFLMVSAIIISSLSLDGTESMNFMQATFCTIAMILDAGCIQFVVEDIGTSGVAITLICLVIVFVGMISFTGAVIGYVTNYISDFIKYANAGDRSLHLSEHIVILNWNTRASEIINDLMYCAERQKVVVLVRSRKDEIIREINERLTDTVNQENHLLEKEYKKTGNKKYKKKFASKYAQKVTVIVREGDVFSSKQLRDISLEQAKSVIILGDDSKDAVCGYKMDVMEERKKGNSQTIKTLMQVADITAAETSLDNQRVIVEITDEWTWDIVSKIIEYKQVDGKCNIVPVRVNKVLGQLLSQFSIMPELNMVYRELLSNKGMSFYPVEQTEKNEIEEFKEYFRTHSRAIPLTYMDAQGKKFCYYAAEEASDIQVESKVVDSALKIDLNLDYWIEQKNVIILGHNSKLADIMEGFAAFRVEWGYANQEKEIVRILVVDDEKNLEKMDYYRKYPFVVETVVADIYDRELICSTIERFSGESIGDTSILVLSDDMAQNDELDAGALANLVYVQDIILQKKKENPDFDEKSLDPIVEIIDPKHHDIVNNYSVNNVVISNRYISKMIMQIGEKDALFDFYQDILTYDTDVSEGYESKEVYTKKVGQLFRTIPPKCTAKELVEALYKASVQDNLPKEKKNPTIALGYIKQNGEMTLFRGNQNKILLELEQDDLLIVYSNH